MSEKINYDDSIVRSQVINFFSKKFNIVLEQTNPDSKIIDLTGYTSHYFGVEVEHGKWVGDFWKNKKYALVSNTGYPTINIPLRKEKYWKKEYYYYNKLYVNEFYDKNIFVRTNIDFTQFILIYPDTILNENKKIITEFIPRNSNVAEKFMSFKKEDVKTYNLIEDKYLLDE